MAADRPSCGRFGPDETRLARRRARARAAPAPAAAASPAWRQEVELFYDTEQVYADFEAACSQMLKVDPTRRERLAEHLHFGEPAGARTASSIFTDLPRAKR